MSTIAFDAVHKTFAAGQQAVRGLTFEIADGELLVLVGPSGSGKSTVLRLIAGLDMPSSGRVLIDGQDVTDIPPQERDLAMVFQSYALYPHMTVRENISFGLRMRKTTADVITARVGRTAEMLGIGMLLDRKPAELSGGQRQRVALGRAIVREPRAFLLDEPLSNLDPALRAETRAGLSLLHRRLETTMVYVTHDQEEAMTLGSRIAVMRDGVLEQIDTPRTLFERPENVFVASFIGSPAMNILAASEASDAAHASLGQRLRADEDATATTSVRVGIRPHDIDIVEADSRDADATGVVEIVEPLGATTLVHVRLPDETERARVLTDGSRLVSPGDQLPLRFRRDRLHLFDAATGRRLPS
jgi:multiple sugar transport system ATP-binding protein